MRKWLVLIVLLMAFQIKADAFIFIDEDYTGNSAAQPNDTGFTPAQLGGIVGVGLGGPIGNQYIVKRATQFTVDQPATVNYLAVTAIIVPYANIYDTARSQYISQRLAQGATPEQIGLEINGDANNFPSFVGPAQSIDVQFSLIKGSVPYRPTITPNYIPMPSAQVLSTASYTFSTDNSRNNKEYTDLLIPWSPFDTSLEPNEDYWLMAEDPKFSGTTFKYSTKLVGEVNTPEPATLLLMGGGLAGAIWRRRKNSKV